MTHLGSEVQRIAEQAVIRLLGDPDVIAIQHEVREELAATPRGKLPSGIARLDLVIRQWTASLVMDELSYLRRGDPAFTIGTDTTPRHWLGHSYPGHCKAGDNPDMIGYTAVIDGSGHYRVTGRIDPAQPPAQLVCTLFAGTMTHPAKADAAKGDAANPDAGIFRLIAALTDKQLNIAKDGSFTLTIGGEPEAGVPHLASEPVACSFGFRQMMPDWTTPPLQVEVTRFDGSGVAAPDFAALRQSVLKDLAGYLRFWGHYSTDWMGGIGSGELVGPVPREGGWGYLAASNLRLDRGEAVLVKLNSGGAGYFAVQFTDPWMIGPAPGLRQTSLNCVQAVPDADGSTTFVLAPVDPGIANWVDMHGLNEGFATMRWQGFPEARDEGAGLIEDFRVVRLSELDDIPGIARITPERRSHQVAERRASFATRYHRS